MRASRGFSLLARATTWPAGEPARWAPCCGGGNPGPAGPVGARAARRGVGVLPAGVSRHCLQRAWGLEAVRPLRGVQVSASPPYIVSIGPLDFIYTTLQLLRHGVRLTGGQDLEPKTGLLVDFTGDQLKDIMDKSVPKLFDNKAESGFPQL
uniref:Uncharacterized protein n=1 Tax=Zea mays TaxID=4577 RepID=A0A804M1J4_MAIZE